MSFNCLCAMARLRRRDKTMRSIVLRMSGIVCFFVACLLTCTQVSAQSRSKSAIGKEADGGSDIRVREIRGNGTTGLMRPPIYAAENVTRSANRAKDWQEIKIVFDTTPEWIDQMTCKFYVLMLNNNAQVNKTPYTLLEGSVTYVQVARGNNHVGCVYLHPNTVARFGEVVACAVEVSAGQTTEEKDDVSAKAKVKGKWWTAIGSEKTVTVMDGYLLSRDRTPFAFINFDDYEQIQR